MVVVVVALLRFIISDVDGDVQLALPRDLGKREGQCGLRWGDVLWHSGAQPGENNKQQPTTTSGTSNEVMENYGIPMEN